jgi:hypothetical protein
VAEEANPEVGEHAFAHPAREVRLGDAREPGDDARGKERGDDLGEQAEVLALDPLVDRDLGEPRRRERGGSGDQERNDRPDDPRSIGSRQPE